MSSNQNNSSLFTSVYSLQKDKLFLLLYNYACDLATYIFCTSVLMTNVGRKELVFHIKASAG